jgi:hypothetical protein
LIPNSILDTESQQRLQPRSKLLIVVACLTFLNTTWILAHVLLRNFLPKPDSPSSLSTDVQPQPATGASPLGPKVSVPTANATPVVPAATEPPAASQGTATDEGATSAENSTYVAVISCGASGYQNLNAMACFAGSTGTEIELTNGQNYGLYKAYQISSLGTTTGRGLEIHLQHTFSLKAQNSSPSLTLGVRIFDEKTGVQIFGKQVSQFGVVTISN